MSYDILFVPRRPDQSWQDALDAAEGTDGLTVAIGPERRAQWDRIVDSLRRRLGEVEESEAEDMLEAAHVGSGLQVSLFPDEAAVTFPYRQRDDVAAFHDQVVDVVGLLESETGLAAWDAQTDAPFDGRIHDGAGVSASARLTIPDSTTPHGGTPDSTTSDGGTPDSTTPHGGTPDSTTSDGGTPDSTTPHGGTPDGGTPDGTPPDGTPPDGTPEPSPPAVLDLAVERRRALRYVALGAVVIAFALLLQAQGQSSTLSGLALAVGVADILIGALMWRSYRRRLEQQR